MRILMLITKTGLVSLSLRSAPIARVNGNQSIIAVNYMQLCVFMLMSSINGCVNGLVH